MANLPPIHCPNCNKRYRLPASLENQKVECKECQHRFRVSRNNHSGEPIEEADVASIFDSLDVDVLLNSPAPGDQQPKKKNRRRKPKARQAKPKSKNGGASQANKRLDPEPKKAQPKKPAVQTASTNTPPVSTSTTDAESNHPNPDLIQEELEFAWAKKERAIKQETSQEDRPQTQTSDAGRTQASSIDHEMDEEELAIFAAVTRQNRRRNFACGLIAVIVSILIGGYFIAVELGNLKTPLTKEEQIWLNDQGFVLKARRVNRADDEDDGSVITLIAGRDFSDIDKFSNEQNNNGNANDKFAGLEARPDPMDPNAPLAPIDRRQQFRDLQPEQNLNARRNPPPNKPDPKVDIDTNEDRRPDAQSVQFKTKIKIPRQEIITLSPRGQFYTADRNFITGLNAKGKVFEKRTLDSKLQNVTAILATPDGRRLIVGNKEGFVRSYQLDVQGRLTEEFTLKHIHRAKIVELKISADSGYLVVYSADQRLSVWDLDKQQIQMSFADLKIDKDLQSFQLHDGQVLISDRKSIHRIALSESVVQRKAFDQQYRLFAFDPSGKYVLFGDSERIGVLDAETQAIKWSRWVRFHGNPRVEFSPDLETAFFSDGGRHVLQLNVADGKTINRFEVPDRKKVIDVEVSFDGKTLLTQGDREERFLFEIPGGKTETPLAIKPLLPLPKRTSVENTPLDSANPKPLATADITPEQVTAALLLNNGYMIVSDRSNRLIVYDWFTQKVVDEHFGDSKQKITTLAIVDGKLAVGKTNGAVELMSIDDGGKLGAPQKVTGHSDPVKFIMPVPETSNLVSVTRSGHTRVTDLKTKKQIYDGKPISSRVLDAIVDPNSDILLAADRELVTLQYKTGTVRVKRGETSIRNATLLPDGKRLAFFDRQKLNLSTTSRGDINLSIDLPPNATAVSFSPDSKMAFVLSHNLATVYRVRGGVELFNFPIDGRSGDIATMLFTPDGKFMTPLSPSTRGRFNIYDVPEP